MAGIRRADEASPQRLQRIADNVVRMGTLKDVPDPELAIRGFALSSYFSMCERLLRSGGLTRGNRDLVEQLAMLMGEVNRRLEKGKVVPIKLNGDMLRLKIKLGLVEDATPIGNPERVSEKSRFSFVGFSARAPAQTGVRRPA